MKLTRETKQLVKSYRLWAVMQAEDHKRIEHECMLQDAIGAHNEHVRALHVRNYNICNNAVMEHAEKLGLYA